MILHSKNLLMKKTPHPETVRFTVQFQTTDNPGRVNDLVINGKDYVLPTSNLNGYTITVEVLYNSTVTCYSGPGGSAYSFSGSGIGTFRNLKSDMNGIIKVTQKP